MIVVRKYRIRKSFTFEAAHQLESAFTAACSDCIHGHSYTVELFLTARTTDSDEMVVDFGYLKGFKYKIMDMWDHGLLLHENKKVHIQPLIDAGVLKESKVHFLTLNPTAELFAYLIHQMLIDKVREILRSKKSRPGSVEVEKVRVHETSTGWAEYGE